MATPNNIEQLRNDLLDVYTWVKQDPRRAAQCKEMTNAAGKVVSTLKLELEYSALRKEVPNIAFLNYTNRNKGS